MPVSTIAAIKKAHHVGGLAGKRKATPGREWLIGGKIAFFVVNNPTTGHKKSPFREVRKRGFSSFCAG